MVADGQRYTSVGMIDARAGDIASLRYPSVELPNAACLHVDYYLEGNVIIEIAVRLDRHSDAKDRLCTLVTDSNAPGGWYMADVPVPSGSYQLFFDAVVLSLDGGVHARLDNITVLDGNCSLIKLTGRGCKTVQF